MIRSKLLVYACLFVATATQAATTAEIDQARARGLVWLVQHQRGDGSFSSPKGLDIQATAAAVDAMIAGGINRSPQYTRALSWLGNAPGSSLDALAWQTGTLAAAGRDAKTIAGGIRDARNTSIAKSGVITSGITTWGAYPGYGAGMLDTALGYGALRSAGVSYTNDTNELTTTALCAILPAQLASSPWTGAWPQALPQNGQPPQASSGSLAATAVMLYELKKQRQAGRFLSGSACSKTSPGAIDTAMTSAKTWLVAQANPDNRFAERNPQTGNLEASSPVVTALAIRALALFAAEGDSAATAAVDNARGWLVGIQGADGNWQNDPIVTARVVAALPVAAGTQLTDSDQDGLPDVIEQKLGTQPLVADAQGQVNNGANSVPGVTTNAFSVSGMVNQAFSYNIVPAGGGGPYTYTLANGGLPPGLTMAGNGTISGIPTTLGSFAFDYKATDAGGAQTLIIGLIAIVAPGTPGDLNDDGIVDVADVALLQQNLLGLATLTPGQVNQADLAPVGAPNGVLDTADLNEIIRKALGIN